MRFFCLVDVFPGKQIYFLVDEPPPVPRPLLGQSAHSLQAPAVLRLQQKRRGVTLRRAFKDHVSLVCTPVNLHTEDWETLSRKRSGRCSRNDVDGRSVFVSLHLPSCSSCSSPWGDLLTPADPRRLPPCWENRRAEILTKLHPNKSNGIFSIMVLNYLWLTSTNLFIGDVATF